MIRIFKISNLVNEADLQNWKIVKQKKPLKSQRLLMLDSSI